MLLYIPAKVLDSNLNSSQLNLKDLSSAITHLGPLESSPKVLLEHIIAAFDNLVLAGALALLQFLNIHTHSMMWRGQKHQHPLETSLDFWGDERLEKQGRFQSVASFWYLVLEISDVTFMEYGENKSLI